MCLCPRRFIANTDRCTFRRPSTLAKQGTHLASRFFKKADSLERSRRRAEQLFGDGYLRRSDVELIRTLAGCPMRRSREKEPTLSFLELAHLANLPTMLNETYPQY